ncbi:hypothetical protein [Micrococcus sp. FDAARGOS_333]|uniref:hypothetical protein n=1 Tax=Micrococcus sp. FDAARGOS_333 TaxID=1930558 RepID=UPI000FD88F7A|nr:hypothetical protein [Micrococcus sp. FDAARGOS_333]
MKRFLSTGDRDSGHQSRNDVRRQHHRTRATIDVLVRCHRLAGAHDRRMVKMRGSRRTHSRRRGEEPESMVERELAATEDGHESRSSQRPFSDENDAEHGESGQHGKDSQRRQGSAAT